MLKRIILKHERDYMHIGAIWQKRTKRTNNVMRGPRPGQRIGLFLSSFDAAGVEFLRLRIDGENGKFWIEYDESGNLLPYVTADGKGRDGSVQLGHLGSRASKAHLLYY